METTIKTSFNFAKEIQCNFITKNNPEYAYPKGLPEFITPYLQEWKYHYTWLHYFNINYHNR